MRLKKKIKLRVLSVFNAYLIVNIKVGIIKPLKAKKRKKRGKKNDIKTRN